MAERTVEVTVLGGYLGAGKTTRLNAVLGARTAIRTAVLVNDFGEVNVDAELVRGALADVGQAAPVLELTNGCVCCQVGDDLSSALEQVLALDPPVERVWLEASGVAEPERVAQVCRSWRALQPIRKLVVVDVRRIRMLASSKFVGKLVLAQLRQADQLVLSRTDQAQDESLDEVVRWLRCVSPALVYLQTAWSAEIGEPGAARQENRSRTDGEESAAQLASDFVRAVWAPRGDEVRLCSEQELSDWWQQRPKELERAKGWVSGESGLWELQGTGTELRLRVCDLEAEPAVVAIAPCSEQQRARVEEELRAWLDQPDRGPRSR